MSMVNIFPSFCLSDVYSSMSSFKPVLLDWNKAGNTLANVPVCFPAERGAQMSPDLWLQAQLWPPPLPGALSPWKLWTLLAVQSVLPKTQSVPGLNVPLYLDYAVTALCFGVQVLTSCRVTAGWLSCTPPSPAARSRRSAKTRVPEDTSAIIQVKGCS